jgi:hypothetical protein
VIAVFVRENNAVELFRRDATLLQAQYDLPRAKTAINKNPAMICGDKRAVSRAPAAEHGQAEHGSKGIRVISICANRNGKNEDETEKYFERYLRRAIAIPVDETPCCFGVHNCGQVAPRNRLLARDSDCASGVSDKASTTAINTESLVSLGAVPCQ